MKKFALIAGMLACSAVFAQQAPAGAPVPPQPSHVQQANGPQAAPGAERGWHKGVREDMRKFSEEQFAAHKKAITERLQAHLACVNAAKSPADLHQCRPQRPEGPGDMRADDMRPPRPHFHCQGDSGCQGPRGPEGDHRQGAPKPQATPGGNAADRLIR